MMLHLLDEWQHVLTKPVIGVLFVIMLTLLGHLVLSP